MLDRGQLLALAIQFRVSGIEKITTYVPGLELRPSDVRY